MDVGVTVGLEVGVAALVALVPPTRAASDSRTPAMPAMSAAVVMREVRPARPPSATPASAKPLRCFRTKATTPRATAAPPTINPHTGASPDRKATPPTTRAATAKAEVGFLAAGGMLSCDSSGAVGRALGWGGSGILIDLSFARCCGSLTAPRAQGVLNIAGLLCDLWKMETSATAGPSECARYAARSTTLRRTLT